MAKDTRDTLHLYTQVVGKIRLANESLLNHWWGSTLYVTARGLTTSLIPHPTGPAFQIDFDFVDHRVQIATVDGASRSFQLEDRAVADFYATVMSMLDELGLTTAIDLGFEVRLAATLAPADHAEEPRLHELCDTLGLGADQRIIAARRVLEHRRNRRHRRRHQLYTRACDCLAGGANHPRTA